VSVRRTLLAFLLTAMTLLLAGELALSWRTTVDAANSAYDRSLLGALKAMDANIRTESGGLGVELPYNLFEFFELAASGPVYFRVATEDGLAVIGNGDLPLPPTPLRTGEPQFYEILYHDEPVRVAAYARELAAPLYGKGPQRIVLQIAESTASRAGFATELLSRSLWRDVLLLVVAGTGILAAVVHAMRPLRRLRESIARREAEDLRPIGLAGIPNEAKPLIEAINYQLDRVRALTGQQREFLDDASHQLRTPLSILRTQLDFAARSTDPAQVQAALEAARPILDRTIRLVHQLLVLARTQAEAHLEKELLDANELAREVTRQYAAEARARGHDYGFEAAPDALPIKGSAVLLTEALANLIDNAIRNAPDKGRVTVACRALSEQAHLSVRDNGPGMSDAARQAAGARFLRVAGSAQPSGAGLGLSISAAIAKRHGGQLEFGRTAQNEWCVSLCVPLSNRVSREAAA
jgi:two-component system sensor histidine kinase TctE